MIWGQKSLECSIHADYNGANPSKSQLHISFTVQDSIVHSPNIWPGWRCDDVWGWWKCDEVGVKQWNLTTYDIAVRLYPHVVARRENTSELVQGCHVHICNPLLPLFPPSPPLPLSSPSPLPHPPTLSSTCCPLLRLPEPHAPSIMELLWCYSSYRTIPWERRRSSIRVTRRSPWQFVMCAAAEDNHSKPGAVCPQVSWSTGPVVSRPLPCFTVHGPFSCFK